MYYSPLASPLGRVTEQNKVKQEVRTEVAPIRLNSRRLVCENTVYSVFFDHVGDAEGHEVLEYLSVLPKSEANERVTGSGVLPVKEGKLGLIRVFRHPLGRWSWEIPKGFLDVNETSEQSAVRELCEETGFIVDLSQLISLGVMVPEAGMVAGCIQLFSVNVEVYKVGATIGELGHGERGFFGRDQIIAMIESGDIHDGCTMSAILKYAIKECWIKAR